MDYVTLMGAEGVERAGHRMSEAAETMRRAAGDIQHALTQHEQFLENWLIQFQEAMNGEE